MDAQATAWVSGAAPRTVLLHPGTNDVTQNFDLPNAPARLSGLIDRIRAAAPAADVFVASIVPLTDPALEARARAFNATVPGIVAAPRFLPAAHRGRAVAGHPRRPEHLGRPRQPGPGHRLGGELSLGAVVAGARCRPITG